MLNGLLIFLDYFLTLRNDFFFIKKFKFPEKRSILGNKYECNEFQYQDFLRIRLPVRSLNGVFEIESLERI